MSTKGKAAGQVLLTQGLLGQDSPERGRFKFKVSTLTLPVKPFILIHEFQWLTPPLEAV